MKDYKLKDWILDNEFHPMTGFYEPPIPDVIEPLGVKFSGINLTPVWDKIKSRIKSKK